MSSGLLVVISGPSGAGKGTIYNSVLERLPSLKRSISVTTRPPRTGEVEGVHYFFRSEEEYFRLRRQGGFLETAEVYGHFYGTPRAQVEELLERGEDVMFEIDICGAMQIRKRYPDSVLIFILPPSLTVLEQRLRGRNTDSDETIGLRLKEARRELAKYVKFDYAVVNDRLSDAIGQVTAIVAAEKCRVRRCRSAAKLLEFGGKSL